jgi:hypothetical protein
MIVRYFTIAGGNKTALVWDCLLSEQSVVASRLLSHVEQVGFVTEGESPALTMMGGELCVNALLALAFCSPVPRGIMHTASSLHPVSYTQKGSQTVVELMLPYSKEDSLVLFEGIGYVCTQDAFVPPKEVFHDLTVQHNVPAFGFVTYDSHSCIVPVVYVAQTQSLIHETACGSGSIALFLATGITEVMQPTGEYIRVLKKGDVFLVEAAVRECT